MKSKKNEKYNTKARVFFKPPIVRGQDKLNWSNKKGDIPVTILVLGVLIICILAFLSFIYSVFKFKESFVGIGVIDEVNSKIEEYNFYKNAGKSDSELSSMFDIKTDSSGSKYIYGEERGRISESISDILNEKTIISIKYLVG